MADDRLSQDEVAAVLRRAAQLDGEATTSMDELLPVAAVEAAAAEVGLAPAAVRQAVAELRAGVLAGPIEPSSDRHVVVEAAVVPLDVAAASDAVARWLSAQTFHRHRGRNGVEVWRVREDWVAGLQRHLDWSASVRLKSVREVVVRIVEVDGGALVRMEATLAFAPRRAPTIGTAAGVAGGLVTAGGTISVLDGAFASGLGALAIGAGSAGGWWVGRSVRKVSRHRVADELAAQLDRIGSGHQERNALDRLRERARRTRGPWMRA